MKAPLSYRDGAALVLCLAGGIAGVYLFFRYLFAVLLPFLIAWGVALLLHPLNTRICKKTGIPLRAVSLITVLLALLLLFGGLWLIVARLVGEIRGFVGYLTENPDLLTSLVERLRPYFAEGGAEDTVGELELLWQNLRRMLIGGLEQLLSGIPAWVGSAVLTLPSFLLFLLICIIAAFYFSLDLSLVNGFVRALLPARFAGSLGRWREGAFRTGRGYLRSYLTLMGLTWFLLLLGFLLFGVPYALSLSLLFAVLDLLPVIGVGTLLIPWSLYLFATGTPGLAIGLLVLYGVIAVVRQIAEPRLLGSSLGIHPIVSLFSLYAGAKFFGLAGMLIGPLCAVPLTALWRNRRAEAENKKPVL